MQMKKIIYLQMIREFLLNIERILPRIWEFVCEVNLRILKI